MASDTDRSSDPFSDELGEGVRRVDQLVDAHLEDPQRDEGAGVELDARLTQRDADVERLAGESVLHRREREPCGELSLLPRAQLVGRIRPHVSRPHHVVAPSNETTKRAIGESQTAYDRRMRRGGP